MDSKKVMSVFLVTSMLANSHYVLAQAISEEVISGKVSQIVRNTDGSLTIVTRDKNQIVRYSSTGSATATNGARATLDASFIDDKRSTEDTAIVGLKGFIPSGKKINPLSGWEGFMTWPYQYIITIENISTNNKVQIVDSLPTNNIDIVM